MLPFLNLFESPSPQDPINSHRQATEWHVAKAWGNATDEQTKRYFTALLNNLGSPLTPAQVLKQGSKEGISPTTEVEQSRVEESKLEAVVLAADYWKQAPTGVTKDALKDLLLTFGAKELGRVGETALFNRKIHEFPDKERGKPEMTVRVIEHGWKLPTTSGERLILRAIVELEG
jgi:hypothetical protein